MNKKILSVMILFVSLISGRSASFPDLNYSPPSGWNGPVFKLSQGYPAQLPVKAVFPWETIDFETNPKAYLSAVLDYCYEGNISIDFIVQSNSVRKWYHAPWLHVGSNAREFVHGLTKERRSRPYELWHTQSQTQSNVAVGFYNEIGGYTLGQVWGNASNPSPEKAVFPEGTVSFKLLFSTASAETVPYLRGAPEWVADLNRSGQITEILGNKVRLLQIDIAVKDKRSKCGGWIFGTFHYDEEIQDANPWRRLRPLTLLWGNDPALTQSTYNSGERTKESWVNEESPIVKYRLAPPNNVSAPNVLGWAGRGNGPVDNPISSCLSCHSTAQLPAKSTMTPGASLSEVEKLRWFRNLKAGQSFDADTQTLDFSLQLGVGIQNFAESRNQPAAAPKSSGSSLLKAASFSPIVHDSKNMIRFSRE